MIGHLKNVLATFNIECILKNYGSFLARRVGLPPIECWPELWVVDDHQHAEAEAILKKTLAPLKSVKKSWHCAGCSRNPDSSQSVGNAVEAAVMRSRLSNTVVRTFSIRNR